MRRSDLEVALPPSCQCLIPRIPKYSDLRARVTASQDLKELPDAVLRVSHHFAACPPERPNLSGGEPAVSARISRSLLLGLVCVVTVKFDCDHAAVIKDQEVESEARLDTLDPWLNSENQSRLTESVVERNLNRGQPIAVLLNKRNIAVGLLDRNQRDVDVRCRWRLPWPPTDLALGRGSDRNSPNLHRERAPGEGI